MSRQEIKGNLARLLATENLVVEHRNVDTASFDVDRRVLTLPNWDRASSIVYDMLVGHEVGHALFTPNIDPVADCPKDYINVVEDVRIEKFMKRKYPGLRKSFNGGYNELNAIDFFEINGQDVEQFNLIDRINLHYKVGASAMIPFEDNEKDFVERVEKAETFDEVCRIAEEIYEYSKIQQKEQEELEDISIKTGTDGGTTPNEDDQTETDSEASEDQQQQGEWDQGQDPADLENPSYSSGGQGGSENIQNDIDEVQTQRSFDDSSKNLTRNTGRPINYIEIPDKVDLDKYVADWKRVHEWIDLNKYDDSMFEEEEGDYVWYKKTYKQVDHEYKEFRKSSQKEVNYLVKEFECRKSADAYARTGTARTGVLDTTKLHTYKFNEDLFKRINVVPDGKNHGLIFILDWSGSMANEIFGTVKQLLNLTAFCKKVQIPFEVYAFTNEWEIAERAMDGDRDYSNYDHYYNTSYGGRPQPELKENKVHIDPVMFTMVNLISSRSNGKDYERMCLNVWREVYQFTNKTTYHSTAGLNLSGTPLNEAIIMTNYIIPEFKKDNDLQKVNVCILSDGEACGTSYGKRIWLEHKGEEYISPRSLCGDCQLRDRSTGKVYERFDGYYNVTSTFIQQVRDRNPGVNVIGFRLLAGTQLSNFVGRYASYEHYDEVQKQWRKEKSAIIPFPKGYSALYAINSKGLEDETEFEVKEDATKGQITKAFKKMLKSKSTNKKLLTSFVDHVA